MSRLPRLAFVLCLAAGSPMASAEDLGLVTFKNLSSSTVNFPETEIRMTYFCASGEPECPWKQGLNSTRGNPPSGLSGSPLFFPEAMVFVRADGGLFQFVRFDFASIVSFPGDPWEFTGHLEGVQQFVFTARSMSTTFLTQATNQTAVIDRLEIRVLDSGGVSSVYDNLLFDLLPDPPPPTDVVVSTGAGSAVTSADFSANFDWLVDGQSPIFTEGGLSFSPLFSGTIACQISLCGGHIGFAGMSGGIYYNPAEGASIVATDNSVLEAVEVMVGGGAFEPTLHGVWETLLGSVSTGTGTFDVAVGTIMGFSDPGGFDELRIGTYHPNCVNTEFQNVCGSASGTALDFVSAQVVPEPPMIPALSHWGSVLLATALGLVGLAGRRRMH